MANRINSQFFYPFTARGRKLKFLSLLFSILLLTVQCSFEKPSAPSWDVEVSIPLISKQFTMDEIADDEDAINVDSTTGLLNFEETSELDEYQVGDQLDIDDITDSFTQELGSFDIDSPGSEFTSVELREIYEDAETLNGATAVIPSFSFETDKKPLDQYDDYAYVLIEEGSIDIVVNNNLTVTLGSPITLEVWDTNFDTLIVAKTSNMQVLPGLSAKIKMILDGKKLPNQLSIRMSGFSPGSPVQPVFINAFSTFEMGGEISNLKASEALAQIPEQIVSSEDNMTITDSMVVSNANIESGAIVLDLGGNLPLDAWIIYELPDFKTPAGTVLVDSFFVRKYTNLANTINLANMSLQPQAADFSSQQIRFNWTFRTIDTGSQMALVRSRDDMGADFRLSNLKFSSVTGKIGSQDVDIEQDDIELDIPADMDSIFFETAQLELVIRNGINFPANIRMNIQGQNESGSVSYLSVNDVIEPALRPGEPKTTVIVLNQHNSNIKDFISILPNLVKVDGRVKLGDPNWVGTVSKDDYVDGEVKITAPFSLRLPAQKIESDVNDMKIEKDVKEDIINNLANGSFYGEISNHLPIGASVEIVFGEEDSSRIFDNPILRIGPLRTEEALTDNAGYVQTAQTSEISFSLSEDEMRTFTRDRLFSGVRVQLDGTHGKYIKVRNTDFIRIKAYTKIKVKVNQD